MPALGLNATHGQETWANYVLDHLSTASVLLNSGARQVPILGREAHVPRLLTDGAATFVAEGDEIDGDEVDGDEVVLVPKKLARVVALSNEAISDAPVDELSLVGLALSRSIGLAIDNQAFSNSAATATAFAGLRSMALPAQTGGVTIDGIITAAAAIQAVGGQPTAAYLAPDDLAGLRTAKASTAGVYLLQDASGPGSETVAGCRLWPTPALSAGTAVVADPTQIVVGIRQDAEISFSDQNRFTSDQVVVRCVSRVDVQVGDVRGLVVLGA